jgi:hypothetical protein
MYVRLKVLLSEFGTSTGEAVFLSGTADTKGVEESSRMVMKNFIARYRSLIFLFVGGKETDFYDFRLKLFQDYKTQFTVSNYKFMYILKRVKFSSFSGSGFKNNNFLKFSTASNNFSPFFCNNP